MKKKKKKKRKHNLAKSSTAFNNRLFIVKIASKGWRSVIYLPPLDTDFSPGLHQEGGRNILSGSEGCLLSDSRPPRIKTIPSIHIEGGDGLLVQDSLLQSFNRTPGLHQVVFTGSSTRNSPSLLFR